MIKESSLIVVENLDVTIVFSENGMTKLLDEIKTKVVAHVPDIKSDQGRKDIASLAYKITRSKTLIDNLGKGVVSDWKKKAKVIDAHRKIARDFLDNLKDKIRQPLTEWEATEAVIKAEEERLEKEKIQKRIDALFAVEVVLPFFDVAMLSDDDYGIMLTNAIKIAEEKSMLAEEEKLAKEKAEKELVAERAELERQKKEQESIAKAQKEKEKALEAERKKIEAEKKAEQARKDLEILEKKLAIEANVKAVAELEKKEKVLAAEKARQAELLPDKTKLLNFADMIHVLTVGNFTVKSKEAQSLYSYTLNNISMLETDFRKEIKEL